MFDKKCKRCSRKVGRDFDFCPYCGFNIKKDSQEKDFGFLGIDDKLNMNNFNLLTPNLGGGFGKLFDSLVKQLDNQMRVLDKEIGQVPKKIPIKSNAISISISAATGKKPEIKIQGFSPRFQSLEPVKQKEIKVPESQISEEKARKLAKMPREEAETNVRRLSDKVIYEISMPGVKNAKDLIINKLENSIEIKAFSKDKVYFKLIPVNLPIINYKLKNEKLVLELKAK